MNTADKSISLLDVAVRRRFAFVEVPPRAQLFSETDEWAESISGVQLGPLLEALNERLRAVGVGHERMLGPALIAVADDATDPERDLLERLRYDVHPLVEEYCFWDREKIGEVLLGLVDERGQFDMSIGPSGLGEALGRLMTNSEDTLPPDGNEDEDGDEPEA